MNCCKIFCVSSLLLSVGVCVWLPCICSQQLETDLKIEREWRHTLQNDLDKERDTVAQLSTEALQINGLKKVRRHLTVDDIRCYVYLNQCVCDCDPVLQEFHCLQDENIQLKRICEDQEKALEELGSKLSEYVNLSQAVSK